MEQTEFKEYIHDNLALVLPKLKENDDLVKNKKMLANGLVFYYLYFSEMTDENKVSEAIKTLIKDEETLTLDQVKKRLDQLDARPVETAKKKRLNRFSTAIVLCLSTDWIKPIF